MDIGGSGFHRMEKAAARKQLPALVSFQKMPEMQQCGGVRDILLKKVDFLEFSHDAAITNGILHALVRRVEPAL